MSQTKPIIDNNILMRALAEKGLGIQPFVNAKAVNKTINTLRPVGCQHALIRIGPAGDGGYIIPDDLEGISHCFSPGVSNIAGFEKHLFEEFGIPSFLADFSVEGPPSGLNGFEFDKKYIHTQHGDEFISLENWVNNKLCNHDASDLILQMDIEGAEYDAIIDTSDKTLQKFRIIVVEFHWLDQIVFDRFDFFGSIFRKITKHHQVVHLHPNNCCGSFVFNGLEIPRVLEVTLLRRDRITHSTTRKDFPHALDSKNVPSKPDLHLPKIWYS